jgi:carbon-monoxide dehydrogenase large subunit
MRTVNSLIGSPIERLEDLRFLRGRGQYVDDLARESLLHAAVLRSSVAHGRIRSIDVSSARALAGVHCVITAEDIGAKYPGNRVPCVPMRLQPLPEFEPVAQPVIAQAKVRYVGEALAVVLAETAGIAEDASRSSSSRTTSAADSERVANSIRRIFSSHSRRATPDDR